MTTPPTPEPSAEALAAANDIMRDFPVIYGFGYELARIIDAEFAALRAEMTLVKANAKLASEWFDDAVQDIAQLRARLERAEEAVEWAAFKFEEEGFAERAAYCREQIQCEGGASPRYRGTRMDWRKRWSELSENFHRNS